MGVSPRTVERHVQIAENLTLEAKKILHGTDKKITKQNLTKLSRLEPEQQKEAAKQLGKILSPPAGTARNSLSSGGRRGPRRSIAVWNNLARMNELTTAAMRSVAWTNSLLSMRAWSLVHWSRKVLYLTAVN